MVIVIITIFAKVICNCNDYILNVITTSPLRRMTFHSNRSRQRDFGTYWPQRDGPVPYQSVFSKKSHTFL